MKPDHTKLNDELRVASGSVQINSYLVSFLYELLRDHLPTADVESIVRNCSDPDVIYTNGWLAHYAENLAKRLADDPSEREADLKKVIKSYRAYFEEILEDCNSPGSRQTYENMIDMGTRILKDK